MATAIGITSVKRFTYRGLPEEFSNKYWFTGTPPANELAWKAFYDALVSAERTCHHSSVSFVAGYGYNDDSDGAHSVWTWEHTTEPPVTGSLTGASPDQLMAGDQAGLIEWRTDRKNSRGKWVYLRKYFHGGWTQNAPPDNITNDTHTAYLNFGQVLRDGTWNTGHILRSQKQTEALTAVIVSDYVTTRTLKRRGKRP